MQFSTGRFFEGQIISQMPSLSIAFLNIQLLIVCEMMHKGDLHHHLLSLRPRLAISGSVNSCHVNGIFSNRILYAYDQCACLQLPSYAVHGSYNIEHILLAAYPLGQVDNYCSHLEYNG